MSTKPFRVSHDKGFIPMSAEALFVLNKVETQRNDLLEALEELLGKLEVMGGCNGYDMSGHEQWPEFFNARSAVAKVRE
jgi:hypothetical protein